MNVSRRSLLASIPAAAGLVKAVAAALDLEFRRVQFTPDLMPSDVIGQTIFDARGASFSFRPGPVFTNLLLADEINRTPPRTQSSLLEAITAPADDAWTAAWRTADDAEREVAGVLPGHAADQGAVLASLRGQGQDVVGQGRLACDVHRRLTRAGCVPRERPVILDRQDNLGAWGRRGSTKIRLAGATPSAVEQALLTAWRHVAPKRLAAKY